MLRGRRSRLPVEAIRRRWPGWVMLVVLAGVAVLITQGATRDGAPAPIGPTADPSPAPLVAGRLPALGPSNATVTMVVFADFECEFCARFALETLPALRSTYGNRLRVVFRHLPLDSVHPFALHAAVAAECAHEQDRFWQMHDELFRHSGTLSAAVIDASAASVGLARTPFVACMSRRSAHAVVERDIAAAARLQLEVTPAFVFDGAVVITGAKPLAVFRAEIDKRLRQP